MSYSSIDPVIKVWTTRHTLTLYTEDRETEVRTVDIVNEFGRKFQIWIDRPIDDVVSVHAWDYKKKRQDWKIQASKLGGVLDEAVRAVQSWSVNEDRRS